MIQYEGIAIDTSNAVFILHDINRQERPIRRCAGARPYDQSVCSRTTIMPAQFPGKPVALPVLLSFETRSAHAPPSCLACVSR